MRLFWRAGAYASEKPAKGAALTARRLHVAYLPPKPPDPDLLLTCNTACRSLCIVDEFGKGTLAADGVGLLCATLQHWAALPAPPRVVLCTHFRRAPREARLGGGGRWRGIVQTSFPTALLRARSRGVDSTCPPHCHPSHVCSLCSEVLQPQYLPRSPQLAFLTMAVIVEGQEQGQAGACAGGAAGGAGGCAALAQQQQQQQQQQRSGGSPAAEKLVFLYRLGPGKAAPSFGLHCAALAGVPEAVLRRARQVIDLQVGQQQ